MIRFTVPGRPCAKQSVRFTKTGLCYQPADVLAYRDKIGWYANIARAGRPMLAPPIGLRVVARFAMPRSWSNKRRSAARWHCQKPDFDNLAKALADGLKGILFRDDAEVAKAEFEKLWADEDSLEIELEELTA